MRNEVNEIQKENEGRGGKGKEEEEEEEEEETKRGFLWFFFIGEGSLLNTVWVL
jgi:hypothetical protein